MIAFDGITPRIVYGTGVSLTISNFLADLNAKTVVAVYDQGVKSAGIVDPILNAIREKGFSVVEYGEVISDPTVEVIEKGARIAKEAGGDVFIAIGGGSALDCAKCMALLQTNSGSLLDYMGVGVAKHACPPWIAVPTTSGTGSEATCLSIITDTKAQRKVMVKDLVKMRAAAAYLDPNLVLGLPKGLTASTGMDALAHAVEGYTIPRHNEYSDMYCVGAIRRVLKYLPTAVENGKDVEARGEMMLAATFGGLGFANSSLHIGHGFSHAIGASLHVPHGTACAWTLPFAMRHAGQVMPYDRLQTLAQLMGIDIIGKERADLISACEDVITGLSKQVNIPTVKDMGLGGSDKMELAIKTALEKEVFMCQASGQPLSEETLRAYFAEIWAR